MYTSMRAYIYTWMCNVSMACRRYMCAYAYVYVYVYVYVCVHGGSRVDDVRAFS